MISILQPILRPVLQPVLNRVGRRTGGGGTPTPTASLRFQGTDNSGIEDGFRFETSLTGSAPWVVAGSIGASSGTGGALDQTYSGLAFNTLYYTQIIAFRSGFADSVVSGGSAWTKPPLPVTAPLATTTGPNSITVTWTLPATEPITGYRVYGQQAGAPGFDLLASVASGIATASITGLADSQPYNFYVVPINGTATESEGTASSIASATTDAAPTYLQEVDADSPTSHWRLGEASGLVATDRKGITNGTYTATGVTYSVAGAVNDGNTGLAFTEGSSAYADFGVVTPGSGAMTIEFWAKVGAVATRFLVSNRTASGTAAGFDALVNNTTGEVRMRFGNGATSYEIAGPTTASTTDWRHFVMVWTGSVARFFIDGVQVGADTAYTAPITGNANFRGARRQTTYCSCSLDEVAVYPTALSPGRIAIHHTSALP